MWWLVVVVWWLVVVAKRMGLQSSHWSPKTVHASRTLWKVRAHHSLRSFRSLPLRGGFAPLGYLEWENPPQREPHLPAMLRDKQGESFGFCFPAFASHRWVRIPGWWVRLLHRCQRCGLPLLTPESSFFRLPVQAEGQQPQESQGLQGILDCAAARFSSLLCEANTVVVLR